MSNGSLRLAFLPSTNLAPLAQYLLQMQGGMKDRKSIATVFTWCHSKNGTAIDQVSLCKHDPSINLFQS